MRITIPAIVGALFLGLTVQQNLNAQPLPTGEQQIKAAVSAAPPNKQEGAKVLGYKQEDELTVLREGSNEMICLADNPTDSRFHVACYYEGLEPFMDRGRELRTQGYSRTKVDSIRKAEIEAGQLAYPERPMGLYSLTGPEDGFDYETGTVKQARPLYVVYVPYATEQSTGISSAPAGKGGSWLMEPGTPWAHIMIPGREITTDDTIGNE